MDEPLHEEAPADATENDETENDAIAQEAVAFLKHQLSLPLALPDGTPIDVYRPDATVEFEVNHNLLAAAIVAVSLPNKDHKIYSSKRSSGNKGQEQVDKEKNLQNCVLTITSTHLRITTIVGEVRCETAISLLKYRRLESVGTVSFHASFSYIARALSIIRDDVEKGVKFMPLKEYQRPGSVRFAYSAHDNNLEYLFEGADLKFTVEPLLTTDAEIEKVLQGEAKPNCDPRALSKAISAVRFATAARSDSAMEQTIYLNDNIAMVRQRSLLVRYAQSQTDPKLVPEPLGLLSSTASSVSPFFRRINQIKCRLELREGYAIVDDGALRARFPIEEFKALSVDKLIEEKITASAAFSVDTMPLVKAIWFLDTVDLNSNTDISLTFVSDIKKSLANENFVSNILYNDKKMTSAMSNLSGPHIVFVRKNAIDRGHYTVNTRISTKSSASFEDISQHFNILYLKNVLSRLKRHCTEIYVMSDFLLVDDEYEGVKCSYILPFTLIQK